MSSPGQLYYYYQLEDIDASGKRTFHGPVCVDWDADRIPDDWEISLTGSTPGSTMPTSMPTTTG